MRRHCLCLLALLMALSGWAAEEAETEWSGAERSRELRDERLPRPFQRLKQLHTPLRPPGPDDWLSQHDEPGQSYRDYLARSPLQPSADRRTIYILPIGDFTAEEMRIVTLTAHFLELFFVLPVTVQNALPLAIIPAEARRHPGPAAAEQVLTHYVLDKILRPRRPDDAVAYLALTASDLWPGEGWNFVYGQASLRDRVGIWSLHRHGDPAASEEAFRLSLRRTLQTASHETAHIFGLLHCLAYECNMNGANHQAEADSRPLALCPSCLAKLSWNTGADPRQRFHQLVIFTHRHQLVADSKHFARSLRDL